MKKNAKMRVLSAVVCLILLLQMSFPGFSVTGEQMELGTGFVKEDAANEDVEILEEDISKRGEYEKHFLQSDGTYLAVSYGESVHKKDPNGRFEEIDNTLSLKNGRFENADKDFAISFAKQSKDELVKITCDGYTMSWGLSSFANKKAEPDDNKTGLFDWLDKVFAREKADAAETSASEVSDETAGFGVDEDTAEEADAETAGKMNSAESAANGNDAEARSFESAHKYKKAVVSDKTEELAQLSEKERKTAVPKISSNLVYDDILGEGINARYSVRPGRVKEDIVLDAPSDFGGYAMDIAAEGLTAVKTENNCVEFFGDDNAVLFTVQTPYMYDAADDTSFDIDVEVTKTEKGFRIAFIPSAEWLNAEERIYPIVIDPTVNSARSLYNAHDVYIYEGSGNTGALADRMYVGIKPVNSAYKKHRAYWRVIALPSLGSNYVITKAAFIVQHPSGTTSSRPFSLYGVDENWTESGIMWANRPEKETLLISDVNRSGLTVTFSGSKLTQRVAGWYENPSLNYGFMIRYTSESTTNPDYNSFWSCDNGSSGNYVPYIAVTYNATGSSNTFTLRQRLRNITNIPNHSVQGFAVGTQYCYSFEVKESSLMDLHEFYRYKMDGSGGNIQKMSRNISVGGLAHANDAALTNCVVNGTTEYYAYVMAYSASKTDYLVKLKYTGNNYEEVARYSFNATADNQNTVEYAGVSFVKYHTANGKEQVQFLLSNNNKFFTVSVPRDGTASGAISPVYKFSIDRLAYEKYTKQGIHYEPGSDKLYTPMWGHKKDGGGAVVSDKANENIILMYTGISAAISAPGKTLEVSNAWIIKNGSNKNVMFEIEGIGFPISASPADNRLWFNANEGTKNANGTFDLSDGGVYTDSQAIK